MTDEHESNRPEYPPGAKRLYKKLRARANGASNAELVDMVERWTRRRMPWRRPPAELSTITRVLDCVDAMTRDGLLLRERDGLGERWTVAAHGKRRIPDELKRSHAR